MTKGTQPTRTPGETPPAATDPAAVAAATAPVPGPTSLPEIAAMSKEDMAAMLAAQAQQIAQLSTVVQKLAENQAPQARLANPEANLPDVAEFMVKGKVSPDLDKPVLTKQGWLVPPTFGFNPDLARK